MRETDALPDPGTPGQAPALDGWSHVSPGKVWDMYVPQDERHHSGEVILLVASDRVSVVDRVLAPEVPDKGCILAALTLWWFERLEGLVPNHIVSTEVPAEVAGRAMVCRRLSMYPVECVAWGYMTPGVFPEYQATGAVGGVALPEGLSPTDKLPEPIFAPSRKGEYGEPDEPLSFEQLSDLIGLEKARRLRDRTLLIYRNAAEIAAERGIIVTDTKIEFGAAAEAGSPEVVLGDELLTPDSSGYWSAEDWAQGGTPVPLGKQAIRDWLESPEAAWDRAGGAAPPPLPESVVMQTRERYVRVYETLTGRTWPS